MEIGAIVALVMGVLLLILPGWLAWYLVRRWRRLATWPRAEATIRRLRKEKQKRTVNGTTTTETTIYAHYAFHDAADIEHSGEVDFLRNVKRGDVLEVMYDPKDPSVNETVQASSLAGRIITYGAIFIVLGGGGIFIILAALDLLPG